MSRAVTAFVPFSGEEFTRSTAAQLQSSEVVERALLLTAGSSASQLDACQILQTESLLGSGTIKLMATNISTPYALLVLHDTPIEFGQYGIERLVHVAQSTGSGLVYSDYYDLRGSNRTPHPVNDYQLGSIRDDFNFGSVVLVDAAVLRQAAAEIVSAGYRYAGWYALRLAISRLAPITRVSELLYSKHETDTRKTGEQQFDYVDPRNRDAQIEMERAATEHLKQIGAYLEPRFRPVDFNGDHFPVEASVIIPVRNRVKTVGDAVQSVLKQKTSFHFNLIIVDNHSTDGTTELLCEFARKDKRIVHIVPQRQDLGIGGCWNEAIHHPACGRFAVQLDSDDIYSDESTLAKVVDVFRREKCAMVIGSYQMTNFRLEQIPPGLIDHKEWTPENGRNNALRINGLGAPRCFYTPILRQIKVPNVSYGEDYAVALAISREYQIGRIYDPIYLCRRWEGNSDADLDICKSNTFNAYKDKIRTLEILARQKKNGVK